MGIILWIIMGIVAGWIASLITGSSTGLLGDLVVGIVGALLGGFLFSLFGQSGVTGFNIYSFLVSIVGAIILLWLFKAIRGGTTRNI